MTLRLGAEYFSVSMFDRKEEWRVPGSIESVSCGLILHAITARPLYRTI